MAAIIAQLTLAARRRKENSKGYLNADKCVYKLKPFDKTYFPESHNPYLRNQKAYQKRIKVKDIAKGM
jgi:hypothetical protein